jgi:hypothetical protein
VSASLAVCSDPALSVVAADRRQGHPSTSPNPHYFLTNALHSRT